MEMFTLRRRRRQTSKTISKPLSSLFIFSTSSVPFYLSSLLPWELLLCFLRLASSSLWLLSSPSEETTVHSIGVAPIKKKHKRKLNLRRLKRCIPKRVTNFSSVRTCYYAVMCVSLVLILFEVLNYSDCTVNRFLYATSIKPHVNNSWSIFANAERPSFHTFTSQRNSPPPKKPTRLGSNNSSRHQHKDTKTNESNRNRNESDNNYVVKKESRSQKGGLSVEQVLEAAVDALSSLLSYSNDDYLVAQQQLRPHSQHHSQPTIKDGLPSSRLRPNRQLKGQNRKAMVLPPPPVAPFRGALDTVPKSLSSDQSQDDFVGLEAGTSDSGADEDVNPLYSMSSSTSASSWTPEEFPDPWNDPVVCGGAATASFLDTLNDGKQEPQHPQADAAQSTDSINDIDQWFNIPKTSGKNGEQAQHQKSKQQFGKGKRLLFCDPDQVLDRATLTQVAAKLKDFSESFGTPLTPSFDATSKVVSKESADLHQDASSSQFDLVNPLKEEQSQKKIDIASNSNISNFAAGELKQHIADGEDSNFLVPELPPDGMHVDRNVDSQKNTPKINTYERRKMSTSEILPEIISTVDNGNRLDGRQEKEIMLSTKYTTKKLRNQAATDIRGHLRGRRGSQHKKQEVSLEGDATEGEPEETNINIFVGDKRGTFDREIIQNDVKSLNESLPKIQRIRQDKSDAAPLAEYSKHVPVPVITGGPESGFEVGRDVRGGELEMSFTDDSADTPKKNDVDYSNRSLLSRNMAKSYNSTKEMLEKQQFIDMSKTTKTSLAEHHWFSDSVGGLYSASPREKGMPKEGAVKEPIEVAIALVKKINLPAILRADSYFFYSDQDDMVNDAAQYFARYIHDTWSKLLALEQKPSPDAGDDSPPPPPPTNIILIFISTQDRICYISSGTSITAILPWWRLEHVVQDMKPDLRRGQTGGALGIAIDDLSALLQEGPPTFFDRLNDFLQRFGIVMAFTILTFLFATWGECQDRRKKIFFVEMRSRLTAAEKEKARLLQRGFKTKTCPICLEPFNLTNAEDTNSDSEKLTAKQQTSKLKRVDSFGIPLIGSDGQPIKILRCGHIFDESCWKAWIDSGHGNPWICPVCRQDVGGSKGESPLRRQLFGVGGSEANAGGRERYEYSEQRISQILTRSVGNAPAAAPSMLIRPVNQSHPNYNSMQRQPHNSRVRHPERVVRPTANLTVSGSAPFGSLPHSSIHRFGPILGEPRAPGIIGEGTPLLRQLSTFDTEDR